MIDRHTDIEMHRHTSIIDRHTAANSLAMAMAVPRILGYGYMGLNLMERPDSCRLPMQTGPECIHAMRPTADYSIMIYFHNSIQFDMGLTVQQLLNEPGTASDSRFKPNLNTIEICLLDGNDIGSGTDKP